MILVGDLGTYLHTLGLDAAVPVFPGPMLNVQGIGAKQAVFITATGGPGLLLEGATDVLSYQFRCRGNQGNADEAYPDGEGLAKIVDDLVITATYPATIGGRRVIRLYRVGGAPSYLATVDRRAHFVCSYLFEIAAT